MPGLVIGQQRDRRDVRQDSRRAGGTAAQKVLAENVQGMNPEDGLQVGPLRSRLLAALVGRRVVMTVVVGLGQDRRNGHLAGVGRDHGAPARVRGAKNRGVRRASLQRVEDLLLGFHLRFTFFILPPPPLPSKRLRTGRGGGVLWCCQPEVDSDVWCRLPVAVVSRVPVTAETVPPCSYCYAGGVSHPVLGATDVRITH